MDPSKHIVEVGLAGIKFLVPQTDVSEESMNDSSVLVHVSTLGAWIPTGTFYGLVEMMLDPRSSAPDAYQVTDEWEEVSEVTIFTNTGILEIWGDMEADPMEHPQFGDGSTTAYRMRVHIRGHQEIFSEETDADPYEHCLVTFWPAIGDEQDVILQSSDPNTSTPMTVPTGPIVPLQGDY